MSNVTWRVPQVWQYKKEEWYVCTPTHFLNYQVLTIEHSQIQIKSSSSVAKQIDKTKWN